MSKFCWTSCILYGCPVFYVYKARAHHSESSNTCTPGAAWHRPFPAFSVSQKGRGVAGNDYGTIINPLRAKFFRWNIRHIFTFHVIPLHWYDTGGWNPSSNKTMTYPFYRVNIMAAGVLATQGARTSAAMILTKLNRDNSVPARWGLNWPKRSSHGENHITLTHYIWWITWRSF